MGVGERKVGRKGRGGKGDIFDGMDLEVQFTKKTVGVPTVANRKKHLCQL